MASLDEFFAKQEAAKAAAKTKELENKAPFANPVKKAEPTVVEPVKKGNLLMQLHNMSATQAKIDPPKPPLPPIAPSIDEEIQRQEEIERRKAEEAGPPISFKDKLDRLDNLLASDLGITIATVDSARSYVQQIFTQLKTEPELDAILIDRDVHNILAVVRHIRIDAAAAMTTGKEKSEKRVAKTKSVSAKAKAVLESFGDLGDLSDFKDL